MILLLAACIVDVVLPRGACTYTSGPGVGTWTVPPEYDSDCVCSPADPACHSLYRMRVADVDGDDLRIEAEKGSGEAPTSDRRWWLLAATEDPPSCLDLYVYDVLLEGTWPAGQGRLAVEVPAERPFLHEAADAGVLILATDGADRPGYIEWFASPGVRVERTCAQDSAEASP